MTTNFAQLNDYVIITYSKEDIQNLEGIKNILKDTWFDVVWLRFEYKKQRYEFKPEWGIVVNFAGIVEKSPVDMIDFEVDFLKLFAERGDCPCKEKGCKWPEKIKSLLEIKLKEQAEKNNEKLSYIFDEKKNSKPTTQSMGEKLIWVNFNPSGNPTVDKVKQKFAEIIDILDAQESIIKDKDARAAMNVAFEHSVTACMRAVKSITLK